MNLPTCTAPPLQSNDVSVLLWKNIRALEMRSCSDCLQHQTAVSIPAALNIPLYYVNCHRTMQSRQVGTMEYLDTRLWNLSCIVLHTLPGINASIYTIRSGIPIPTIAPPHLPPHKTTMILAPSHQHTRNKQPTNNLTSANQQVNQQNIFLLEFPPCPRSFSLAVALVA